MHDTDDPGTPGPKGPDPDDAADAALDAVEPDRLLPGEDESSVHPDDALHWKKVYAELLEFKRSLLTVTEVRLITMEGAARAEVEETDLKVLLAEAERLERRLHYWEARSDASRERSC
jgi:hypothetical protein